MKSMDSEKYVPGGRTRAITNSRETSRLLNTLEEELCRESIEGNRFTENFVELCQVGIEWVQVCIERTLCLF
jgi:hypothetical protein